MLMEEKASLRSASTYTRIRDLILHFELYPGTRITEAGLARRLGVSRTPVREAIQRLAAQGYVIMQPHRGCFVREFDIEEIMERYQVRVALELLSMENAVANMPDTEVAVLADEWRMARLDEGLALDSVAMALKEESFHIRLARGGGNSNLADYLEDVNNHIRIVRRLDFTDEQRIRSTYAEHESILNSIQARDAARARTLMESHIRTSENFVKGLTLRELQRRQRQLTMVTETDKPLR